MITLTQNLIKIIFVDFIDFFEFSKKTINSYTNILYSNTKIVNLSFLKKIVDFIDFFKILILKYSNTNLIFFCVRI